MWWWGYAGQALGAKVPAPELLHKPSGPLGVGAQRVVQEVRESLLTASFEGAIPNHKHIYS